MNIIAITGKIGSGKSTVAHIFNILGLPVYSSDERAKFLMQHDENIKKVLINTFGDLTYLPDGNLNRSYLSQKVFSDSEMLAKLNKIVHPEVFKDFENWMKTQQSSTVAIETALLLDILPHIKVQTIIVVVADDNIRIHRAGVRDHKTQEEILKRDKHQPSEQNLNQLADYIIYNNGEKSLIGQCIAIYRQISTHYA